MVEAGCDINKKIVARPVAEGIIDVFEIVEIQENKCQFGLIPLHSGQGHLQTVIDQDPVGQTGEGIVLGLVFQGILLSFQLGNVMKN
jgi:hypothetical protein